MILAKAITWISISVS